MKAAKQAGWIHYYNGIREEITFKLNVFQQTTKESTW